MAKKNLESEILLEFRNKVSAIQKLDVAYLTIFLGILGILKIERQDFFEIISEARFVIGAFFVIILIDSLIADLVFREWIASKTKSTKRVSSQLIIKLVCFQPLLHVFFISFVGLGYLAYFSGMADFKKKFQTYSYIQNEVEFFILHNDKSPNSLDDIDPTDISIFLKELGKEPLSYEKVGKKNYKITFGGWDNTLDTEDDYIVTSDFQLRDIIKDHSQIKNDMCFAE